MRLRQFSIRTQLVIVFVLVTGCATALMAILGYRMSRVAVRSYALHTLEQAGENRRRAVLAVLSRRHDHVQNFLERVELSCGFSGMLNRPCARESMQEFVRSEVALCAVMTPARGPRLRSGRCPKRPDEPPEDWLQFFEDRGKPYYAVEQHNPELRSGFTAIFDAGDLLADARRFDVGETGRTYLVLPALASMAAGGGAEARSCSDRQPYVRRAGQPVLLRQVVPVPQVGGCVVAEQNELEAVASSFFQRKVTLGMAAIVGVVSLALAFWLAHVLTAPIARLKARALALQKGDFDTPVPAGGPAEVRQFARVFDSMAAALKESRNALRQRERVAAEAEMAAALAHEINNPLSSVTYSLALMSRAPGLDEKTRGLLAIAQEETRRMARISKQLLSVYRGPLGVTHFGITEVVEHSIQHEAERLQDGGIEVERRFETDVEIVGSESELRLAFGTLLRHAASELRPGDAMQVHVFASHAWNGTRTPGARVAIRAAHRGRGSSRNHVPPRTGMALWAAENAIQKHGGSVHMRALRGRGGMCVRVFLPLEHVERVA